MRIEKIKMIQKRFFMLMLACSMLVTSAITVFAKDLSATWNVEGFSMKGKNEVEENHGTGTTSGSLSPYKNHVVVSIYDNKNQQMNIGSSTKITGEAGKTLKGKKIKRAYTTHGICDRNNHFIGETLKSLNNPR